MFERMRSDLVTQLAEIRAAGLEKPERVLTTPQGAMVGVADREVLNLCANNYFSYPTCTCCKPERSQGKFSRQRRSSRPLPLAG